MALIVQFQTTNWYKKVTIQLGSVGDLYQL